MVVVDLISQPCFYFIRVFVEGLGIGGAVGLAIGRIILIGTNVAIGFFKLSL